MIHFSCKCGKKIKVDDKHAGKKGKCLQCGQVVIIPADNKEFLDTFVNDICSESRHNPNFERTAEVVLKVEGATKKCPDCGEELPDIASVCWRCGGLAAMKDKKDCSVGDNRLSKTAMFFLTFFFVIGIVALTFYTWALSSVAVESSFSQNATTVSTEEKSVEPEKERIIYSDKVASQQASPPRSSGVATEVRYTDVLLSPEKFVGQEITMRGEFYSHNTEKKSFEMIQDGHHIEVFYGQLPKEIQALILSQRNYSNASVFVKGTLKRYADTENSYYITASN